MEALFLQSGLIGAVVFASAYHPLTGRIGRLNAAFLGLILSAAAVFFASMFPLQSWFIGF